MNRLPGFADLMWLASRAHDLAEARHRGTSRPWQQPSDLDPGKRVERDERARQERVDRNPLGLGEHPAPLHLDVHDLMTELLAVADDLAERVAQAAGVERLPPASSAMADSEPYLRHAAAHLAAAVEADGELGRYVEEQAAQLRYAVAAMLGEFVHGQTLKGHCPFCGGGTERRYTLRVREYEHEAVIVCESGTCEPTEADCGIWVRGNPAWSLSREGAWLADRIERMGAA